MSRYRSTGFTIVELLIVIVVIGILAAIVIVAFSGIQQRANNTSRISAVSQSVKAIRAYEAMFGYIPGATGTNVCLTKDNICSSYNEIPVTVDNTPIMTELAKAGKPIESVPRQAGNNYGILYNVWTDASRGSETLWIFYWLEGTSQPCGITGATPQDKSGMTQCVLRLTTR